MSRLGFIRDFIIASLIATPVLAAEPSRETQVLRVRLDEATILKLDNPIRTLVIGNPSIADGVVINGTMIIVTGKSFGTTNLISIDQKGEVMLQRQIEVQQPQSGTLTIQRGDELDTYNCSPNCRRSPVIGDTQKAFAETIGQTQTRNGLAQSQTR